jgi:hypothetical protein
MDPGAGLRRGLLIAREAEVRVLDDDGSEHSQQSRSTIAVTPALGARTSSSWMRRGFRRLQPLANFESQIVQLSCLGRFARSIKEDCEIFGGEGDGWVVIREAPLVHGQPLLQQLPRSLILPQAR